MTQVSVKVTDKHLSGGSQTVHMEARQMNQVHRTLKKSVYLLKAKNWRLVSPHFLPCRQVVRYCMQAVGGTYDLWAQITSYY